MKIAWVTVGLIFVAIGGVGVIVPGLPTTVFMILAAWCFSKSSPRLERWVLELPGVGPMVRDFRAGLGMPRRAKTAAIGSIVVAVTLSTIVMIATNWLRVLVVVLGAVGVGYIARKVPTRETVLAAGADQLR